MTIYDINTFCAKIRVTAIQILAGIKTTSTEILRGFTQRLHTYTRIMS